MYYLGCTLLFAHIDEWGTRTPKALDMKFIHIQYDKSPTFSISVDVPERNFTDNLP